MGIKSEAKICRKNEIFYSNPCKLFYYFKTKILLTTWLYSTFEEQLNRSHPLYILANQIYWNVFEEAFAKLYSEEGRPGKPTRLMVSLIILKHILNIIDNSVVEQWAENAYYQYFSSEKMFAVGEHCKASELVHLQKGRFLDR